MVATTAPPTASSVSKLNNTRAAFALSLVAEPRCSDAIRALRYVLKSARRVGLRVTSAREIEQ